MVEKYLLRISSLNLTDSLLLATHSLSERGYTDIQTQKITKDFYLEIEEELDSPQIQIRYCALSKLLLSFIRIPKDTSVYFDENIETIFLRGNINDAFEYGMVPDLVHNLYYFYTKFTEYPKEQVTIKKCELILFIRINVYLIFLMIFFLRLKNDMKNYIKFNGDELEEISLKFIKISNSDKYTPARIFLCLHLIYLAILTDDYGGERVNEDISTCRRVEEKQKYLTKSNIKEFFKPKVPLIFSATSSTNQIEKFYRRNMLKRDKPELERVIIVQILKILLSTFENAKNQSNISEYIKDYIVDIILKKYYFEKEALPTIVDENTEIDTKTFLDMFSQFSEEEKDYYSIIEILNKLSITAVIISFYYKALKNLQKNNLIQYSYFAFHLKDSRGLYVFLRILKQEHTAVEEKFISSYNNEIISSLYSDLVELTLLYNLKLVYKISYKNNEYIYKLIECKVPIMLKKILSNFEKDEKIKRCCLKLFKAQIKFCDKNWRMENVNIITSIYLTLDLEDGDEIYLERKDKNNKESTEFFNEEELKKIYQEFHEYNYLFYLNNPDEYDKYKNENLMSKYAYLYQKIEGIVDKELSNQSQKS